MSWLRYQAAQAAAASTAGGGVTVSPAALVTGAPVLGSPTLTQDHALDLGALAAGTPVLGAPALTQNHVMSPAGLATGAPVLGAVALSQNHVLAPAALVTGLPELGRLQLNPPAEEPRRRRRSWVPLYEWRFDSKRPEPEPAPVVKEAAPPVPKAEVRPQVPGAPPPVRVDWDEVLGLASARVQAQAAQRDMARRAAEEEDDEEVMLMGAW